MSFRLITEDTRRLSTPKGKAPHHFMKQRLKFSEDYYEMNLARHGKRKTFGKRDGLEELEASLNLPYGKK